MDIEKPKFEPLKIGEFETIDRDQVLEIMKEKKTQFYYHRDKGEFGRMVRQLGKGYVKKDVEAYCNYIAMKKIKKQEARVKNFAKKK